MFEPFFLSGGFWVQPLGQISSLPWATMLALRLDCSTAALTTPLKDLPIWKLVELKILDFSVCTRTGISILTSTSDQFFWSNRDQVVPELYALKMHLVVLKENNWQAEWIDAELDGNPEVGRISISFCIKQ